MCVFLFFSCYFYDLFVGIVYGNIFYMASMKEYCVFFAPLVCMCMHVHSFVRGKYGATGMNFRRYERETSERRRRWLSARAASVHQRGLFHPLTNQRGCGL